MDYDELSSGLSNWTNGGAFIKFCEGKAEEMANDYHFKVIMTSRTMYYGCYSE